MNRISEHLEQEASCCEEVCPKCDLINEYIALLSTAKSDEDVREHLSEFFDDAHEMGYTDALKDDVMRKVELIDHIEGNCDCGCEVD